MLSNLNFMNNPEQVNPQCQEADLWLLWAGGSGEWGIAA